MLRITSLKNLVVSLDTIPNNFGNLQTVRFRRKPRWLPVAKSKVFRVPPRTITPEDERLELMRLHNNYRTQMKAIRSYLHGEYNVKSVIIDTEVHEKEFEKEFTECSKINDEWNEGIRIHREARHLKELEDVKQTAFSRLDERLGIREKMLESAEELVRKEIEASKSFITSENVDEAIEQCLANVVDYNFSIDLEGGFYEGRTKKPEAKLEVVKSSN